MREVAVGPVGHDHVRRTIGVQIDELQIGGWARVFVWFTPRSCETESRVQSRVFVGSTRS